MKAEKELESRNARRYLIRLFIAVLAGLIITKYLISPVFVCGNSMLPTYQNGDLLIVIKKYDDIKCGDVVTARHEKKTVCKRVAGLPNETVFIDGKIYSLGSGEYFLLGDNESVSVDSRTYGAVSAADITGKVIFSFCF